jgi:MFS transporter, FHS family, L-fucose permease
MTTKASGRDGGTSAGKEVPRLDLSAVTLAFGALGLFGSIAGTLVPAVREAFGLSLSAAMSVQWMALVGVGVSSLPLARLMERIGAARMVIAALAMSFAGCIAVAAVMTPQIAGDPGYALFLVALLMLSIGATALQVSINPLVVALGPPRFAASRITLAQGVNSLGMLAAVTLSSVLVLARVGGTSAAAPGHLLSGIAYTYLACALFTGAALLLAIMAFRVDSSASTLPAAEPAHSPAGALRSRWALAGSLAIAAYVGAEGAIGAMLTSFLHQPQVMGVSLQVAGFYFAAVYCGGMIAGRFLGGILLRAWQPSRLLAGVAVAAAASCLVAVLGSGTIAAVAILLVGPLNAIMFPVIFAISLERSTAPASAVSGLLVLATSGGVAVSILAGLVGDRIGIGAAFAVPMCAYLVVAAFAVRAGQSS